MSHFVVFVIGDDVEKQLAPYDESIEVEPYFSPEDMDLDSFNVRTAVEVLGKKPEEVTSQDAIDAMKKKYPDVDDYVIEDGKFGRMTTYNPKSKWDWYQVGGRWQGLFVAKPGVRLTDENIGEQSWAAPEPDDSDELLPRRCDRLRADQIDWDAMWLQYRTEARSKFKVWRSVFEEHGKPFGWSELAELIGKSLPEIDEKYQGMLRDFESRARAGVFDPPPEEVANVKAKHGVSHAFDRPDFVTLFDNGGPLTVELLRPIYHGQPAIFAYNRMKNGFSFTGPVEAFGFDEDEYVKNARNWVVPYAFVINGEWVAKGKMGWFGMSNDKVGREDWNSKFWDMIESLPPETMITVVDCHI